MTWLKEFNKSDLKSSLNLVENKLDISLLGNNFVKACFHNLCVFFSNALYLDFD